jgi:isopropylmalate/homocitrate/citramalate synthase
MWRLTVENKTEKATALTAWGKKIDPINYEFTYSTYVDFAELVAAKDELTADEQLKVRNSERKNNARQKALTAELDAAGIVKPTAENDPQVGLRDMFKTLQTAKLPDGSRRYTDEQAREIASTNLGVEWAE